MQQLSIEEIQKRANSLDKNIEILTKRNLQSFINPDCVKDIKNYQAVFTLKKYYIALTSPIVEKREILEKHCLLRIFVANKTFFVFYRKKELMNFASRYACKVTERFTVSYKNKVGTVFNRTGFGNSDPKTLFNDFEANKIDYTLYRFNLKDLNTWLPVFTDERGNKTAKHFANLNLFHSKQHSIKYFYLFCVLMHVMNKTGIMLQFEIQNVKIYNSDLRKLLPSNFYLKDLDKIPKVLFLKGISKGENYYIFHFDFSLNFFDFRENTQFIKLPLKFIYKMFSPKVFNSNLKYFLLIIFGFHLQPKPQIRYKLSTIISTIGVSHKRANQHILRVINKPLQFLSDIGVVKNYLPITKEQLKKDSAIYLFLREPKDD